MDFTNLDVPSSFVVTISVSFTNVVPYGLVLLHARLHLTLWLGLILVFLSFHEAVYPLPVFGA